MAETLGSLCDKLTIVELKHWHTTDAARRAQLATQGRELAEEIDELLRDAVSGRIARERLTFAHHKVHGVDALPTAAGSLGALCADLARKNCELWHEQEKVYEVQAAPGSPHDAIELVQRLGRLNLERTELIDAIDRTLLAALAAEESLQ